MCEISEKWFKGGEKAGFEKGIETGELKKAREASYELAKLGLSPKSIAQALKVSLDTVKSWLSSRPMGAK